MIIKLENLRPNPLREENRFPVEKEKLLRWKERIKRDGLWKGALIGREKLGEEGIIELAFGLHRLTALLELNQEFPNEGYDEVSVTIEKMDDEEMLSRMIRENEESTFDNTDSVKHKNLSVEAAKKFIESEVKLVNGIYEDLPDRIQKAFGTKRGFETSIGIGTSSKTLRGYDVGLDIILRYLGKGWNREHISQILKYISTENETPTITDSGEVKRPVHRSVAERMDKMHHAKATTDTFSQAEVYTAFPTEEAQHEVLDQIYQEREEAQHKGDKIERETGAYLQNIIREKALQKIEKEGIQVKAPEYKKNSVDEVVKSLREDEEDNRNNMATNRKYFQSTFQSFKDTTVSLDRISIYPEHMLHYDRALLLKDVIQRIERLKEYDDALGYQSITNTRVYDALDCDNAEEFKIMKAYWDIENDEVGKLPPVEEWINSDHDSVLEKLEGILEKYKQKDRFPKEV